MKRFVMTLCAMMVFFCVSEAFALDESAIIYIKPEESTIYINDPNVFILDVRNQDEYDIVHIANSHLIPLPELKEGKRLDEIPTDRPILVRCKLGVRATEGAKIIAKILPTDAKLYVILGAYDG